MSQITHEEARRLINFNTDQALAANTNSTLDSHLDGCVECRKYASELGELENLLRAMKHRLNLHPTPLNTDQIMHRSRKTSFGFLNHTMVTRITTVAMAFLAITVVTWQFFSASLASPAVPTAIPIPTPSTFTATHANVLYPNCGFLSYQVQVGDTLDDIALRFSIPVETIMDFNGMKEKNINPAMQIRIPVCEHTPTVTIDTPNSTITITPQFEPITATPG